MKRATNYINIELDQNALETVARVFEKMIKNAEYIDGSMYDLTEFVEFEQLTERLKSISESASTKSSIPMTFNEWATFSSYAAHAYDLDEELTPEEESVMVKVNSDIHQILMENSRSTNLD